MIQVDILQIKKCTAGYCTHTHTYTYRWGGGGVGLLIICRFEEMSFMDISNSYLVLLHNIPLFWKRTDESA